MTPDPDSRTLARMVALARLQVGSHRPMLRVIRASGVPVNADDPDPKPDDPKADPKPDPKPADPVTGDAKTAADVARLQAALDAERTQRKAEAKTAKATADRLAAIEAADATDLEKATQRADAAEATVATLTESVRTANLVAAFGDSKLGLVDASAAAALATGVEFDDDHQPTNADKIAADLTGRYAFLKGTPNPPPPADINAGGGAGGSGGSGPSLTAEQLSAAKAANMSPEEWAHYSDPNAGLYEPAKT